MVYQLSSRAHRQTGMTVLRMISTPPMVGVPLLPRCVCGPSVRTTWPTLSIRSREMMAGPNQNATRNAVTTAPAARNVWKRKRLKAMLYSASGTSRW